MALIDILPTSSMSKKELQEYIKKARKRVNLNIDYMNKNKIKSKIYNKQYEKVSSELGVYTKGKSKGMIKGNLYLKKEDLLAQARSLSTLVKLDPTNEMYEERQQKAYETYKKSVTPSEDEEIEDFETFKEVNEIMGSLRDYISSFDSDQIRSDIAENVKNAKDINLVKIAKDVLKEGKGKGRTLRTNTNQFRKKLLEEVKKV